MKTCFATIVSANYLAYAKVLGASLAEHASEADFRVLVVDRASNEVADAVRRSGLSTVYAHELPIRDFEQIAYQYDIVELNTALKPSFLKQLFAQGYERVVYLDPDIRVFKRPEPVFRALDQAQIVLTPHSMAPVMDGLRPSDIDFLRVGSFNLGFVALRQGEQTRSMLDWWESRCLRYGFNDTAFGVFVDQKWMDLVPSFFDSHCILRHKGCNVAYWNLHERAVRRDNGQYVMDDGSDLIFFHFSGVKASAPGVLSRHQNRHVPQPGSVLAELVSNYAAQLLSQGHETYASIRYSYETLDDGRLLTTTMRRALCISEADVSRPFSATSSFQRELRNVGVASSDWPSLNSSPAPNSMSFDNSSRQVRLANNVVRVLARCIGVDRMLLILRYASFLSRQSNYASVLLRRPLVLEHTDAD